MNAIRLALAITLVIMSSIVAVRSQKIVPCAGVDPHSGDPIYADGSPRPTPNESPTYQDGDKKIIDALKPRALEVVGKFEGGWGAVGSQQQLSLGYLQWNWDVRTLVTQLFAEVTKTDLAQAEPIIRNGLTKLKEYSDAPNDHEKELAAQDVISSWRINDTVKPNIANALAKWLVTPGMRAAQTRAMQPYLEDAFWYARAWLRDSHSQRPLDARLVAYFFDLKVFQKGTKPIWTESVDQFRKQYAGDKRLAAKAVTDWLQLCTQSPESLLGKKVAAKNVKYWNGLIDADAISDAQVNLLVYAMLRAQVANGYNDGSGKGIYQPNILNRRGVITVGGFYSWGVPCWDPFGPKKQC